MGGAVEKVIEDRRLASDEIWKNLEMKESMLRLKSGQRWLKEDD